MNPQTTASAPLRKPYFETKTNTFEKYHNGEKCENGGPFGLYDLLTSKPINLCKKSGTYKAGVFNVLFEYYYWLKMNYFILRVEKNEFLLFFAKITIFILNT